MVQDVILLISLIGCVQDDLVKGGNYVDSGMHMINLSGVPELSLMDWPLPPTIVC